MEGTRDRTIEDRNLVSRVSFKQTGRHDLGVDIDGVQTVANAAECVSIVATGPASRFTPPGVRSTSVVTPRCESITSERTGGLRIVDIREWARRERQRQEIGSERQAGKELGTTGPRSEERTTCYAGRRTNVRRVRVVLTRVARCRCLLPAGRSAGRSARDRRNVEIEATVPELEPRFGSS